MTIRTMFVIESDGSITERALSALPSASDLERQYFGGQWSEHVVCLWNGKRAHAFVDETGALKQLPANMKATAIYQNAERKRRGLHSYGDLSVDPAPYVAPGIPLIYGRMLFWPHSAPGWEPEHAPWREHLGSPA